MYRTVADDTSIEHPYSVLLSVVVKQVKLTPWIS